MRALLALLLFLPFAAQAQPYPQPLSDTVSDYANLLPPSAEARISEILQTARDETGIHITVVTMGRIKNYGSGTQLFATYAKNLFNDWGIGDPVRNDGILILIAKDDREMRIAIGTGYDAPYDGLAQRSIDSVMRPFFRNNRYPEGIEAGAIDVINRIAKPFAKLPPPPAILPTAPIPNSIFGVVFAGFALLASWLVINDKIRRNRGPNCSRSRLIFTDVVVQVATSTIPVIGQRVTRCNNCAYENRETYATSVEEHGKTYDNGTGGSGGGGGFGGGRSSGGGASGKW